MMYLATSTYTGTAALGGSFHEWEAMSIGLRQCFLQTCPVHIVDAMASCMHPYGNILSSVVPWLYHSFCRRPGWCEPGCTYVRHEKSHSRRFGAFRVSCGMYGSLRVLLRSTVRVNLSRSPFCMTYSYSCPISKDCKNQYLTGPEQE